jgi:hypothetical protein
MTSRFLIPPGFFRGLCCSVMGFAWLYGIQDFHERALSAIKADGLMIWFCNAKDEAATVRRIHKGDVLPHPRNFLPVSRMYCSLMILGIYVRPLYVSFSS